MKELQRDFRSKRESLVKIIDQQREDFAFNARPLRNATEKIDTIRSQLYKVIKPFSYIVFAVSFFRTKAILNHPAISVKKYRLLGSLLRQGFRLIVNRKRH